MIFEDRSDKFFNMDNRYVDIWLRTLGPGPFSLLCLFKRMCKGETENVFPRMKREDWAEYMGISLQTLNSYVLILKKHNLIQIKTPKGSDRLQHKPSKYIIPRISESILKEKDYPKPLSKNCRFGDIVYNPDAPFFIKTISPDTINSITSGCENVSTSGRDRKYSAQLISTVDISTEYKKTVKDSRKNSFAERVVSLWNVVAEDNQLSSISKLSPSRINKILSRSKSSDLSKLSGWRNLFSKVTKSSFLLGTSDSNSTWKVSFDWLIENDKNYLKVLEEAYPNNKKKPRLPAGGAEMEEGKYDDTIYTKLDTVSGKKYKMRGETILEEVK